MLIFRISIEIFYIYYVWPGLARTFFSARVFRPWHIQRARSATENRAYRKGKLDTKLKQTVTPYRLCITRHVTL
ncbi:hypothetical protein HanXRQr2_Chr02g0064721 [Helianthus annuus]|uniref:Uncharacterized protein n=1 Tax=Helianthus annuus TaxID=4232 RepID=A0A9K3JNB9_HELAN|nr:hypothetical protein HanXRQr2_Chr02g0064721 [Helianthus annuus]